MAYKVITAREYLDSRASYIHNDKWIETFNGVMKLKDIDENPTGNIIAYCEGDTLFAKMNYYLSYSDRIIMEVS
ncbi:hypothetical protein HSE3_gp035 [Bacillus phage vB_BceM-HSE3]|nr:hypothetical protein HSE3_gp035 [Bacillus phage vB_BceM-HSE3]